MADLITVSLFLAGAILFASAVELSLFHALALRMNIVNVIVRIEFKCDMD